MDTHTMYVHIEEGWREKQRAAKVVASVWGAEYIKFFAALAVLPWSIWKNRLNLYCSFKSTEAK